MITIQRASSILWTALVLAASNAAGATPVQNPNPAPPKSAAPTQPAAPTPAPLQAAAQSPVVTAPVVTPPSVAAPVATALPTYAQAGPRGARLRSLADEKGHLLCDIPAGTVLKLRGERAGWVQVEIPGGFAAWTSGQYLSETETPGQLEFNGDRVNLRPQPQADNINNFPVGTLSKGARVQLIERANPERALKEDWVRIWTPAGTAAWLRKAEAEALASGADGAKQWADAVAKSTHLPAPIFVRPARGIEAPPTSSAKVGVATDAVAKPGESPSVANRPAAATAQQASAPGAQPGAQPVAPSVAPSVTGAPLSAPEAALATARANLAAARTAETPDLVALRASYEQALALDQASGKPGSVTEFAHADLEAVVALEAAAAMRAEMEASKLRVAAELEAQRKQVLHAAAAKDPLTQTYAAHGTLVRRAGASGAPLYWLVQGGRDICQLTCSNGRYRLEQYAGRYLGIHGETGTLASGNASIDAARIEVLRP
jgi:hypothetical protein